MLEAGATEGDEKPFMWPEEGPYRDSQRPALVDEGLGERWRQESGPLEAQDKVSLLGVGSFALK